MGKIQDLIKKILSNANNNLSNTEHPIPSTEIDNVDVRFSISEEVPVTRIDHVDNLKFKLTQRNDKDYLSEIVITVSTKDFKEAESMALRKARLLCNLISYKCKKGIVPTYTGLLIKYTDGHTSVRGIRSLKVWSDDDLELDAEEINNVENDPKHSMYQHFSRSFIALLSYDDYATVMRALSNLGR